MNVVLADTRQGIAHIGVGGFHRAHQAYYTDALMNTGIGLDWSICGIGLRDEDRKVRDDLASQDYLYTLFELGDGDDTQSRIIGSIIDMLLAEDGIQVLIDKLASPGIRIVSLTIKRLCRPLPCNGQYQRLSGLQHCPSHHFCQVHPHFALQHSLLQHSHLQDPRSVYMDGHLLAITHGSCLGGVNSCSPAPCHNIKETRKKFGYQGKDHQCQSSCQGRHYRRVHVLHMRLKNVEGL